MCLTLCGYLKWNLVQHIFTKISEVYNAWKHTRNCLCTHGLGTYGYEFGTLRGKSQTTTIHFKLERGNGHKSWLFCFKLCTCFARNQWEETMALNSCCTLPSHARITSASSHFADSRAVQCLDPECRVTIKHHDHKNDTLCWQVCRVCNCLAISGHAWHYRDLGFRKNMGRGSRRGKAPHCERVRVSHRKSMKYLHAN